MAHDDVLPTRSRNKVKKPEWGKPRGKTLQEHTPGPRRCNSADRAEQSSKVAGKQPMHENTPENSSDEEVVMLGTPPRFPGESQGRTQ